MAVRLTYGGWSVLLSLFVLSFVHITVCSSSWWSLALENDISERQVNTTTILCETLHNVLNTTEQQAFCTGNKKEVNYIAIGTRNAIVQCQQIFADSLWNCTTFGGDHLFGTFLEENTRETAVINALLSAGGQRRLARACRDEKLDNCPCKSIGTNGVYNGSFITFGCAYNGETSESIMLNFLRQPNVDTTSALAHHNYMVGSHYVKKLKEKCHCKGFSGSCTVQACYYLSQELETIASEIRSRYDGASVQVNVSITSGNATLTPLIPNIQFNRTTDLVYVTTSPSFCLGDSAKGILGTRGRPCNTSNSAVDSCNVICCGRGYNTIVKTRVKQCCRFVYCCRVECTPCGTVTEYEYQCN